MIVLGLLKSGKVRLRHTIDRGNLIKTSWNAVQQNCPHHGDALLDGNAQSVRYGERIMMDRGNLIVLITKMRQIPKFSSWEVTQQNFVNKVKDQVRTRQKRMSNVADSGEEHSIIW